MVEEKQTECYAPLLQDSATTILDIDSRWRGSWYSNCFALIVCNPHNKTWTLMCATLTLTCFPALQDTLLIVYGHWSWYLQTRAKCTRLCNELVPHLSSIAGTACLQWMWQHKLISSQKKHSAMMCSSQPSSDSILAVGISNHVTDDILSAVEQFICITWLDACVMARWTI